MAAGITLFCMAVACSNFVLAIAFNISGCKLSFSNALMVVPLMQALFELSPKNYTNADFTSAGSSYKLLYDICYIKRIIAY
jgi:hypothetical protein